MRHGFVSLRSAQDAAELPPVRRRLTARTAQPPGPRRRRAALGLRSAAYLDSTGSDERVEIRRVDTHVLAELGLRDTALCDKTADEPRRSAEALGGLVDVEHWHQMVLAVLDGNCLKCVRASLLNRMTPVLERCRPLTKATSSTLCDSIPSCTRACRPIPSGAGKKS